MITISDIFFGSNLKYLREKRGLEQKDISTFLGLKSATSVTNWERGTNLARTGHLSKLADFFNVTMHDLVHTDLSIPTNIHPAKIRNIPLIGTIACGEPITAEQNIDEYVATLDEGLPSGDLFYLNAKGDSMEPKIPDGSKVLCHAQPDVENGEIAAVLVNGDEEATLKKVHKFSNYVLLEAINEAYEPYVVDAEHPARIVGKAVSMKVDF